jgi:endoglucanase
MASGGTDINNIDTSPINEIHVLYGAVVGGPDRDDRFWGIRSDSPETEVESWCVRREETNTTVTV